MKAFNNISRALFESKHAIGMSASLFLALVILFSSSPQFGVHVPNDLGPESRGNGDSCRATEEKNDLTPTPGEAFRPTGEQSLQQQQSQSSPLKRSLPIFQQISQEKKLHRALLSDRSYDGCEMWGNSRTASGTNKSRVYFIPPPSQLTTAEAATWSIRSQSRKIIAIREVLVRSLNQSNLHEAPNCTVRRSVPAVVFAVSGLTHNFWHAFSEVLVPLFTTARAFGGEVELLATDTKDREWFLAKYHRVFRALSRYEVVALDTDLEVRCYPHLIVGLLDHRDLDIDPARAPNHYDMLAFRTFVREAYSLPPLTVTLPCKSGGARPRAMVILRGKTRRFEQN